MTANAPVQSDDQKLWRFPSPKSFATLHDAHHWVEDLLRSGLPVQMARIPSDRFRQYQPRNRMSRLLGVTPGAEGFCKGLCPGEWRVEMESPGTAYQHAGILGPVTRETRSFRFSIWYSRFLPYAFGMMMAERDWRMMGIDFESINSYYGTCLGFVNLGQGDGYRQAENALPEYHRIDPSDCDLFHEVYAASSEIRPPQLPFDEAYMPCVVYVALHRPDLLVKHVPSQDDYRVQHVIAVCEKIGRTCLPLNYRDGKEKHTDEEPEE